MVNTETVRRALIEFVQGRLAFANLREQLAEAVRLEIDPDGLAEIEFLMRPLPNVLLRIDDIRSALQRFKRNELSSHELALWASVITLLNCFDLDCADPGECTVVWNILDAIGVPIISNAHEPRAIEDALSILASIRKPARYG